MRTAHYENVVLTVEGNEVAARVRVRTRKQVARQRDAYRSETREFARDREYA